MAQKKFVVDPSKGWDKIMRDMYEDEMRIMKEIDTHKSSRFTIDPKLAKAKGVGPSGGTWERTKLGERGDIFWRNVKTGEFRTANKFKMAYHLIRWE